VLPLRVAMALSRRPVSHGHGPAVSYIRGSGHGFLRERQRVVTNTASAPRQPSVGVFPWPFNAVYERHFPEPRPVQTTVGAALLRGAKVKITAVARQPARP
jgi:hypothetical protein